MLGALLLAAAYLPAHRLLDPARTGVAGTETRAAGDALWGLATSGTALACAVALGLTVLFPRPATLKRLGALAERMLLLGPAVLAILTGTTALLLCVAAAVFLFHRLPTLVDGMVELLHARAWSEGTIAAPRIDPVAARTVQNGWWSPSGWVSIYPPGHTALLALGFRLGAPWIIGPALTAFTVGLTTLVARRLLPEQPRVALLGSVVVALSPFVVLLGSGYLSHTSAAAGAALTIYAALRARDGRAAWATLAGLATGLMVTSRPWAGLVLGALALLLWSPTAVRAPRAWTVERVTLWVIGGLPAALAFGLYDARLFGDPFLLGYDVAFGPAHGLGLHRDPWGAVYGVREMLAYSGFDLMTLGSHLLELPISAVGLVGVWLIWARRLPGGAAALLGWALLPVVGNAFYWHHGYHLGPRMLFEAAPAWCLLAALAWVGLARAEGRWGAFFVWLALVAIPAGLVLGLPQRIAASRWSEDALARATVPVVPGSAPSLVFVHGSWPGRVAARLAGAGMRRDSIETALRRNDLCRVDAYARALDTGAPVLPRIDFEPLPGSPPALRSIEVAPGAFARIDPAIAPDVQCTREAGSDRLGTLELEPLIWQTGVPGIEDGSPLLFRDLGPEANALVRARYPERTAWMQRTPEQLLPYEEAELGMWGEPTGR